MWCGIAVGDAALGIQGSGDVFRERAGVETGSRRAARRRTGVVLHRPFQGAPEHNMFHTAKSLKRGLAILCKRVLTLSHGLEHRRTSTGGSDEHVWQASSAMRRMPWLFGAYLLSIGVSSFQASRSTLAHVTP
jgi:hypothetical protein